MVKHVIPLILTLLGLVTSSATAKQLFGTNTELSNSYSAPHISGLSFYTQIAQNTQPAAQNLKQTPSSGKTIKLHWCKTCVKNPGQPIADMMVPYFEKTPNWGQYAGAAIADTILGVFKCTNEFFGGDAFKGMEYADTFKRMARHSRDIERRLYIDKSKAVWRSTAVTGSMSACPSYCKSHTSVSSEYMRKIERKFDDFVELSKGLGAGDAISSLTKFIEPMELRYIEEEGNALREMAALELALISIQHDHPDYASLQARYTQATKWLKDSNKERSNRWEKIISRAVEKLRIELGQSQPDLTGKWEFDFGNPALDLVAGYTLKITHTTRRIDPATVSKSEPLDTRVNLIKIMVEGLPADKKRRPEAYKHFGYDVGCPLGKVLATEFMPDYSCLQIKIGTAIRACKEFPRIWDMKGNKEATFQLLVTDEGNTITAISASGAKGFKLRRVISTSK